MTSRWVVAEAEDAADRKILLPVLVEPVQVPLQFRRLLAADLTNWSGAFTDPHFKDFLHEVHNLVGAPPPHPRIEQKPEVGDIFLSYSREDEQYAKELLEYLRTSGLSVWADDRIDYGDRWWKTIVANIRGCVAMVVVMTPRSEESKWVEREILFADEEKSSDLPIVARRKAISATHWRSISRCDQSKNATLTFVATLKKLAATKDAV